MIGRLANNNNGVQPQSTNNSFVGRLKTTKATENAIQTTKPTELTYAERFTAPVEQLPWYMRPGRMANDTIVGTFNALKTAVKNAQGVKIEMKNGVPDITNARQNESVADKVAKSMSLGLGVVQTAILPITAPMAGGEELPLVGDVFKIVNGTFGKVGNIGKAVYDGIESKLPFSQETKDTIRQPMEETFALLSQIALGKVAHDVAKPKLKKLEADVKTAIENDPVVAKTKSQETQAPLVGRMAEGVVKKEVAPTPTENVAESPLIQEARKYKTAEEFVKAQGTPVYHGGDLTYNEFDFSKSGKNLPAYKTNNQIITTTTDIPLAKHYGANLTEAYIDPTKIKEFDRLPLGGSQLDKYIEQARKEGYSAISSRQSIAGASDLENGVPVITVFDKNAIKTKSQLTDIWNKANEQIPKQIDIQQTAPSGLAKSIEQKAIENGLTKQFSKLAEYNPSTIKEQARIFNETVTTKGIDEVRKIVRGESPLPEGQKAFPFVVAMEEYLKKNPDPQLAYDLANSPHVSSASEAGSQLGLGQNRVQDSFTKKVEEIRKVREVKMKTNTIKRETIKKQAKQEMDKVNIGEKELGKLEKFITDNIC